MKFRIDPFLTTSIALGSLLCVNDAHAYLDPGAGSMLAQLLLAGFAGISVAIKMYFRTFWTRLGRREVEPAARTSQG